MAIKSYLETHGAFRVEDMLEECGRTQTNRNLLSAAVRAGKADKVRRGVYVSRVGRFAGADPDRYEIARALFDDPVFAYQSALELHGCAHNIAPRLVTCFSGKTASASYGEVVFKSWKAAPEADSVWVGIGKVATTPEQTFVDCLRHPERALGVENSVRSVGMLEVDPVRCLEIARACGPAVLAKTACILDLAGRLAGGEGREAAELARREVGASYAVLGPLGRKAEMAFDSRWRVYIPRETVEWLEE